jgi:hypothetical protein
MKTAFTRSGIVQRLERARLEEGRPPALWRGLFFHAVCGPELADAVIALGDPRARFPAGHLTLCGALGLTLEDPADEAPRQVLSYLGITATRIVRLGARWSFPFAGEEASAEDAIVVPVGGVAWPCAACLPLLGAHDLAREAEPQDIADLIAIPVKDGAPLSFNGTTASIGAFSAREERVRIATNGLNWLKRHVVRARKMKEEMSSHLVAGSLDLPDRLETLLLDRSAFSFRMEMTSACAIPDRATSIACPDSSELADFIAGELKTRTKLRPAPQVLGPKA